ncbi:MAG: hypothetical protein CBB68_05285 [Rhodospirillaceae bacterium TMED8]|nr:MAG: hypothetical protein CBB68_05285 [Rhodospirillaceae bacterium TMED8]
MLCSIAAKLKQRIIMNKFLFDEDLPVLGPHDTADITRGVCRYLRNLNYSVMVEFKLKSKRRVDVIGLNSAGKYIIVEIKSSVNDFKLDKKWHEYTPFADRFYFAVANGFPIELLPSDYGVMIADAYHAHILRDAPILGVNANRRKHQNILFAKTAANRLYRTIDKDL